jgi:hypothetical protein
VSLNGSKWEACYVGEKLEGSRIMRDTMVIINGKEVHKELIAQQFVAVVGLTSQASIL